MKPITFIIYIAFYAIESHAYDYDTKYYDQTIDHFNFASYGSQTFKQKYLYNDTYWDRSNGPIFFYTGNEGPIEGFLQNSGLVYDLAVQSKALIVFAEHRFYGSSLPFGKDSFTPEKISLLTLEQAMADYAIMIKHLKEDLSVQNTQVIAFGGSYGGMLAAYMRFKYPNVIDGALAASAPIYLIAGKGDRTEFFADVTKDFEKADPMCPKTVMTAFSKLDSLVQMGDQGLKTITETFRLCKPLTAAQATHLKGWVRNSFTSLAMMDYPYPTHFLAPLPGYPVNYACKMILAAADPLQGLAEAAGLFYNGTGGSLKCFDIFTEFIECADPTGCGTGNDGLAWDYQACTELILPKGSNGQTDMFPSLPFTLKMRDEYCQKTWNVKPRNDWLDISVWGEDIKSASNIIFSNGELDPWRGGGVLSNISDTLVSFIVKGGAHHYDMRGSDSRDIPSVIGVRAEESNLINKWIAKSKLLKRKNI
ncbi:dipeptidyl peptidase 2-like [Antedon mediterranea]|uniref:dipeptidyl peptidase 2-like n=1 Tax=Antedon mediterranea TaxID=105859 RepID=UPI003AF93D30